MHPTSRSGRHLAALLILIALGPGAHGEDWPSWGGPRGDFTVEAGRLEEEWPAAGPPRLWERPLGGGYSSILFKDGRLFTMYRDGNEDVLVALDAATGATVWENRDTPIPWSEMDQQFGLGPNTTPLLVSDRVVGVGISGRMRAVEAGTGKLVWLRDLPRDFGRRKRVEEYGYSGNPLAYNGTILTQVGGQETAIVAFDPADGSVVWQSAPGGVSYAAPTLLRLSGREHYVYFGPEGVVGLDPATGATLWKHPIETIWKLPPKYNNGNHLTPVVSCSD